MACHHGLGPASSGPQFAPWREEELCGGGLLICRAVRWLRRPPLLPSHHLPVLPLSLPQGEASAGSKDLPGPGPSPGPSETVKPWHAGSPRPEPPAWSSVTLPGLPKTPGSQADGFFQSLITPGPRRPPGSARSRDGVAGRRAPRGGRRAPGLEGRCRLCGANLASKPSVSHTVLSPAKVPRAGASLRVPQKVPALPSCAPRLGDSLCPGGSRASPVPRPWEAASPPHRWLWLSRVHRPI